jgi:hypothetical protein
MPSSRTFGSGFRRAARLNNAVTALDQAIQATTPQLAGAIRSA